MKTDQTTTIKYFVMNISGYNWVIAGMYSEYVFWLLKYKTMDFSNLQTGSAYLELYYDWDVHCVDVNYLLTVIILYNWTNRHQNIKFYK